jgi:hypothetical protein
MRNRQKKLSKYVTGRDLLEDLGIDENILK